jgi:hypothetical protein
MLSPFELLDDITDMGRGPASPMKWYVLCEDVGNVHSLALQLWKFN